MDPRKKQGMKDNIKHKVSYSFFPFKTVECNSNIAYMDKYPAIIQNERINILFLYETFKHNFEFITLVKIEKIVATEVYI